MQITMTPTLKEDTSPVCCLTQINTLYLYNTHFLTAFVQHRLYNFIIIIIIHFMLADIRRLVSPMYFALSLSLFLCSVFPCALIPYPQLPHYIYALFLCFILFTVSSSFQCVWICGFYSFWLWPEWVKVFESCQKYKHTKWFQLETNLPT